MNILKITTATFVALFSGICYCTAQESDIINTDNEHVILYNSQPVKVELDGDHIKSFVGEVSREYMTGYILTPKPITPINSISRTNNLNLDNEEVNANYAILLDHKVHLNFKPGYATLDKSLISKLDEVVYDLKQDPSMRALIVTHITDESDAARKLGDNRLSAATAYLKVKGVSLSRIQTERQTTSGLVDLVSVNFLQ